MFIKKDKTALRCAEPNDAMQIYEWENDRKVWHVSDTFAPYSLFQIEQFLMNNNDLISNRQLRLMIDYDGQSIGCIDIFDYDAINQRAGIGILIDKNHRHQGHAHDALVMTVQYLFENAMLHQVYCSVDKQNTDSQQLFLGVGFELCGHRKQWKKTQDGFIDELEFQLINHGTDRD